MATMFAISVFALVCDDYQRTAEWAEKALKKKLHSLYAHLNLSAATAQLGELIKRCSTPRRLAVLHRKDVQPYLNLAKILIFMGRKEEAQKQVQKALISIRCVASAGATGIVKVAENRFAIGGKNRGVAAAAHDGAQPWLSAFCTG
ncbi:MAG: hypothetical protein R3E67_05385 [Pseudomonadales bacterium]